MTTHSIYNAALETRPAFAPHTSRHWTPEEAQRLGVEFKPDRDSGGKVIRPPSYTPYSTGPKKTANRANKTLGKVDGRTNRTCKKYGHVTKEFTLAEMALGKSIAAIEKEQGMTKYFLLKKCRRWGIAPPKKLRGEKSDGYK
jgi:hypothetical protein